MLVATLLEMHASVYFIFGIYISMYFCHDLHHAIFRKYAYIFVFDISVQTCGNLDAENKMQGMGKETYLVLGNSGSGEEFRGSE